MKKYHSEELLKNIHHVTITIDIMLREALKTTELIRKIIENEKELDVGEIRVTRNIPNDLIIKSMVMQANKEKL